MGAGILAPVGSRIGVGDTVFGVPLHCPRAFPSRAGAVELSLEPLNGATLRSFQER